MKRPPQSLHDRVLWELANQENDETGQLRDLYENEICGARSRP